MARRTLKDIKAEIEEYQRKKGFTASTLVDEVIKFAEKLEAKIKRLKAKMAS